MNKLSYRIIFSAARGQLIAVSECTNSQGKCCSESPKRSVAHQPNVSWLYSALASAALLVLHPQAVSQILADTNAPTTQRPTVLTDSAGRPLVNIQTPSAAGVSRNTYSRFDVQSGGIVLNNARASNPWLAQGEARVILNEVNSSSPSYLGGGITVNGQRAQVVIANPSGIKVDGASFVNAGRVTLTTGAPTVANGELTTLSVTKGQVEVTAKGMTATGSDFAEIISRAALISGRVDANSLSVVTGPQAIDYTNGQMSAQVGTGTVPTWGIDTAALGGMYAGSITLLATEAGVGVRNAGTWSSTITSGQLIVTANGLLQNTGRMEAAITSLATVNGNIDNSGTLLGRQTMMASAGSDLNLTGNGVIQSATTGGQAFIHAKRNVNLSARTKISADGNVQLTSDGTITGTASTLTSAAGDITLMSAKGITLTGSTVTGQRAHIETGAPFQDAVAHITITGGQVNGIKQTAVIASGNLSISSAGATGVRSTGGHVFLQAAQDLSLASGSTLASAGHFTAYAGLGLLLQGTSGSITSNGQFVTVNANGDISLSGGSVSMVGSKLSATGLLSVEGNTGDITLNALTNANGTGVNMVTLATGGDLNLSSFGGSLRAQGVTGTGNNINVVSNGNTRIAHAQISSGPAISSLDAKNDLVVGSVHETGNIEIVGASLKAVGKVQIAGVRAIELMQASTATPTVQASHVQIQGRNINTEGAKLIATTGNLSLQASSMVTMNNSQASAGSSMAFISKAILNRSTTLTAKDVLSLSSSRGQNHFDVQYSGGALSLYDSGDSIWLNKSALKAVGTNNVSAQALTGQLNVEAGGSIGVDQGSQLQASTDLVVAASNGDITIAPDFSAGSTSAGKDQIIAGRDLTLSTAKGFLRLRGRIYPEESAFAAKTMTVQAGRDMLLAGASVELQASQLMSGGDMRLAASIGNVFIDGVRDLPAWIVPKATIAQLQLSIDQYTAKINAMNAGPVNQLTADRSVLIKLRDSLAEPGRGIENATAKLQGKNIRISSANGVAIYGAQISATDQITIQSAGTLPTPTSADSAELLKPVGTLITGLSDWAERGVSGSGNYAYALISRPSIIEGGAGVQIQAVGSYVEPPVVVNSPTRTVVTRPSDPSTPSTPSTTGGGAAVQVQTVESNVNAQPGVGAQLVVNDSAIRSARGQVNLQSQGDMRLESGQEEFYQKTTNTYSQRSWLGLKKKTTTEVRTNEAVAASPVVLEGQSIVLKSGGSLDAYATEFWAPRGQIQITAANALGLYAIPEINLSTYDVSKRSSFLGLTYSKSTTITTRQVATQLPASLVAERVSTASGWDTRLQGTVFQTSLGGATISAGVGDNARADAKIILEGIKKTVVESSTKESNYVVWQRKMGSGSTIETLIMPQFSGPVAPVFNGPVLAQIPEGDFKVQVQTLSQQPGMGYLANLSTRANVNWQPVKLAFDQWSYKQEGLTQAGAALLAVAVAWATGGMGADLLGTTTTTTVGGVTTSTTTLAGSVLSVNGTTTVLGSAINAGFASLSAQAAVTLVNNKGDIGKTLKELGSSQTIKATLGSMLTAGALTKVGAIPEIKALNGVDATLTNKLTFNLINASGRALTYTAINGGSLEDAFKSALIGAVVDTAHGEVASQIKALESNYLAHKLAHALAGCVAGAAAQGSCQDGAIGAAVGEMVVQLMPPANRSLGYTDAERVKALNFSKLVAGAVAAYAGGDAQTAITTAETAVKNNGLMELFKPRPVQKKTFFTVSNKEATEKTASIDTERQRITLIQPAETMLYAAGTGGAQIQGYTVIFAHASDGSIQGVKPSDTNEWNVFLEMIKSSGAWKPGQPILLDACNTGRIDAGVASALAKSLGTYVTGATTQTWNIPAYSTSGLTGAYDKLTDNVPNLAQPGLWRTFGPTGALTGVTAQMPQPSTLKN